MVKENDKIVYLPRLGLFTTILIVIGAVIGLNFSRKPRCLCNHSSVLGIAPSCMACAGVVTFLVPYKQRLREWLLRQAGNIFIFRNVRRFFCLSLRLVNVCHCSDRFYCFITYVLPNTQQYFFTLPRFPEATEKYFEIFIPFIVIIYHYKILEWKLLLYA